MHKLINKTVIVICAVFCCVLVSFAQETPKGKKELKIQNSNLKNENQNLSQTLVSYKNTIDSLKNANNELNEQLKVKIENAVLEGQNKKASQEEKESLLKSIEAKNKEMINLKADLDKANVDYKALLKKNESENKTQKDEIKKLNNTIKDLEGKIGYLNSEIDRLRTLSGIW